jgi:hypothetical protein
MTAADLDALERLLAEATPGRWRVDGSFDICRDPNGAPDDNGDIVCRGYDHADARLIVAMHSALPELIAAARERDGLRAHYDTAGPEHNLLALLDLYEERRASATAERDALRAEVERMRAVVEAAREIDSACDRDEQRYVPCRASSGSGALCRACRVDVALAAALAALDGKDSAK